MVLHCERGNQLFRVPNHERKNLVLDGLFEIGLFVAKNVFLSITWKPVVPSSEFRAEQFSPLCVIWELLFLKMCSF